jgi:hypothetical protein
MAEFIERGSALALRLAPSARVVAFGHVGDGNVHFDVLQPPERGEGEGEAHAAARDAGARAIHDLAHDLGGSISAEHGLGVLKSAEALRYKTPAEVGRPPAIRAGAGPRPHHEPARAVLRRPSPAWRRGGVRAAVLFVLSPAKTLDFTPAPEAATSRPEFVKDAAELARIARKLTRAELMGLMHISPKLAELNVDRFQQLDPKCEEGGVQAALAFAGDVYDGLRARELDGPALDYAQAHLRILSGLYGLLRPLDCIQPYRLEMGVGLATRRGATLYDFWGDRLSRA